APGAPAENVQLARRSARSGKSFSSPSRLALAMPRSVMMPLTRRAGVTSKAGLAAALPGAATATVAMRPSAVRPVTSTTSRAAGVVGDDGMGHAVRAELVGGERGALIARPRLVHPHVDVDAGVVRHVYGGQRRAPIDAGEPARVAMGEHVDASAFAPRRALEE